MCDCFVVVGPDGVLFGKNSDRDVNEAQLLDWQPARRHGELARLHLGSLSIAQARHTHAVLLSRPFWMWGAEMGANEHGVVIGNEAVFTKGAYEELGLTGMEMVRLALERADTAERAVETLVALLEAHGQGGRCGLERADFRYDNSFLVADARGAFVLETAGRAHRVERVSAGARAISNGLSIPAFARAHASRLETFFASANRRRARVECLATEARSPEACAAVLRDHGPGRPAPCYSPLTGALGAPCAHAGGLVAGTQTVGSWISELRPDGARHWATATAAPCTGIFKPVRIDEPIELPHATDRVDGRSPWWRHEALHRAVMKNPRRLLPLYADSRDALEARFFAAPPPSAAAFAEADEALTRWRRAVDAGAGRDTRPLVARRYWARRDRAAGLR